MSYLAYWKLKDKPFEGNPNIKFFFVSHEHGEALARLRYMIRDRNMGIGVLTGEIGCGKTITRFVLEKMLETTSFEVVSLENSDLPFIYLLAEFLDQIEAGSVNLSQLSKYELMFRFKKTVRDRIVNQGKHLVIFLDEAQQMDLKTLDELKNLTNLTSKSGNYLTIILVGQPELRDILHGMPQVDQRVSMRFHLNFLSRKEVKGYVEHRLSAAGHPTCKIFDKEAINLIYIESKGIPRRINRICKLALDHGYSLQLPKIGKNIITSINKDLHRQRGSERRNSQWMKISA
jgi:general secretion pathway protein A